MPSTVLSLIQTFADKLGLNRPAAFISATDKASRQYQSILKETVAVLGEYRWQQQKVPGTFVTVAAALQGKLQTLLGAGYAGLVKDSIWNNTRHMRIFGPISDQAWNALQVIPNAGPEYQCYVSQDNLYITPTPRVGETITLTFITKYNVVNSAGNVFKEFVTADDDTLVFPDYVVNRLFEAKWRKLKGESGWEDDYNDAMSAIARNISREGGVTLALDGGNTQGLRPGIIIPNGSW